MAWSSHQLNYEPIPNTGRVHVVLTTAEGRPLLCGANARQFWPLGHEPGPHAAVSASILLGPVDLCDHGGTYREPVNIWTGRPAG